MAKNIFAGVNNVAKKPSAIYVGVNNKARKVKEVYAGVGGVARKVWPNNLIPDNRYQSLTYLGMSTSGFTLTIEDGVFNGYNTRIYMQFKMLSDHYDGGRPMHNYITSYLFAINSAASGYEAVNGYYNGSSSMSSFCLAAAVIYSNIRFMFEDGQNSAGSVTQFTSTTSENFITNNIYTLDFNNNRGVYLYNNTGYYSIASHNLVGTFSPRYTSFRPAWEFSATYNYQKKFYVPLIDRVLYSLKIYNGNTLIKDYIPCYRVSDKYVGMYDLVNRVVVLSDSVKLTTANVLYAE